MTRHALTSGILLAALTATACGASQPTPRPADAFHTPAYQQTLAATFTTGVEEQLQDVQCKPAARRWACVVAVSDYAPKYRTGALWHLHYTVQCAATCSITAAGAQDRVWASNPTT